MALQDGTQLQNIGNALSGFSAGLQGQLPQFQQGLQQQQLINQQQQERQQQMAIERQKTMFTDAQAALSLLDSDNVDGVIQLGLNRLELLQNFPDANPEDTQRLTQLAIAAKNGSEEAKELLRAELENTVEIGKATGVLGAPERGTKVVGDYLVDDQTGEVVFSAASEKPRPTAKDENGILRYVDGEKERVFPQVEKLEEELTEAERFERAGKIRAEIKSANEDFTDIANSWDRIAASANDPSPAGDLALIFNFMKMLDPGSTVREGEFANAQNSGSIPTRITGLYNRIIDGQRLPANQKADFFKQAQNIFDASKERADNIIDEYVRVGEKYGLKRDDIVIERGASPELNIEDDGAGGFTITTDEGTWTIKEN